MNTDTNLFMGFSVVVNNSVLPPECLDKILEISITEFVNPPNSFQMEVFDPTLEIISSEKKKDVITEGSLVEIYVKYPDRVEKVFTGEVSNISVEMSGNSRTKIKIEGYDLLHRMTRGTCYRKLDGAEENTGLPDCDVVGEIAKEMNLKFKADPTPKLKTARVQNNESNLAFLNSLAETNGFYLWVEDDVLYFQKERTTKKDISLEWGKDLLSFSARLSTVGLVNSITVQGRDNLQAEDYSYKIERSINSLKELSKTGVDQLKLGAGGKSAIEVNEPKVHSMEAAKLYAEKLMKEQEKFITASGNTAGNCNLKAGMTIEIKNVGRFSGNYMVEEASHTIGVSGFRTSFQARKKT